MTTIVEQYLGQPVGTIAASTAAGGDYALHDSVCTAYLDGQHTVFGSGNDQAISSPYAIYDRPLRNYIEYIRSGDGKYLTRGNSGVVGFRDGYVIANGGSTTESYRQFVSLPLHYLLTGDATTLAVIGDLADYAAYLIGLPTYADPDVAGNSQRVVAERYITIVAARYVNAPSDNGYGGTPGGNNWATVMDTAIDKILAHFGSDGSYSFVSDGYATYAYQQGMLDDALIHTLLLGYLNSARRAAVLAHLIKRENFRWTVMADQYAAFIPPTLIYLSGPSPQEGGTDPVNGYPNYHPPGSASLAAWTVGSLAFLYNQTADPTYRTRGLQLLHSSFAGDHAYTGAIMTNLPDNPLGAGIGSNHHKVLSEITRTSWRAPYFFLNTPAVTHSGVPINTVLPVITQPTTGDFTCTTGTWSNSPTSYNYAWCRRPFGGGNNIIQQTSSSPNYSAQSGDIGYRLFCLITGTNATGSGIIARAIESAVVTSVGSGGPGPLSGTTAPTETVDAISLVGRTGTQIRLNWV